MSTGDARRKAKELFERFQWQAAYYEESTDRREMDDYYRGLNLSAQPRQLFSALSDLLERSHATRPNYNKSRLEFLYPAADLHEDGKLQNIYSGIPFDPIEAIQRELALVTRVARSREADIGDLSLEALLERDDLWDELDEREAASPFNCEHVVPQSWFDRSEPMRGDLHHLFACETRCNSFRGNIPYWQFSPETEAVMEACGRREENKFEPKHGKGSVARATMYFLLRYPGMIGNDLRELNQDRLLILLDWHRNAAPTRYEKHRNRVIFKVQGNRNPLIDKPELASEELLKRGFAGFRD
jgi:endonuclease I